MKFLAVVSKISKLRFFSEVVRSVGSIGEAAKTGCRVNDRLMRHDSHLSYFIVCSMYFSNCGVREFPYVQHRPQF